jgi:hypothetical protein
MKHTPGPWKVYETSHRQSGPGGEQIFKVAKSGFGGGLIADVSCWWVSTAAAMANARIIAAAPDLLEALELVYNDWEALQHFDSGENAQIVKAKVRKIVNTALNKAKGG